MFGIGVIVGSIAKICMSLSLVDVVSKVIQAIGKALGIIKDEDEAGKLGDAALQAEKEGITPDKYSTFDEYKRALDNFKLDPDMSKSTSLEDKERKFIEICALGMKEQYPDLKVEEMLTLMDNNPKIFTKDGANTLGRLVVENPSILNDIVGFVSGTGRDGQSLKKGMDALVKVEMEQNPNLTEEDAIVALYSKQQ